MRLLNLVSAVLLAGAVLGGTSATAHAATGCDASAVGSRGAVASCSTYNSNKDEEARVVLKCRNSAGQIYYAYGQWADGSSSDASGASCSSPNTRVSYWGQLRWFDGAQFVYSTF
ncbi:hypothetical protein [Streptosporangium sp. NPDC051022]|uniref:hypothetical protein n=1 Tax=Streptosporangium sp. NPDC051022 TaxID=3155752 RepID=UPI00342587D5